MRVALIPSDIGACCFYRLAWPAAVVQQAMDWKVELYHPGAVSLSPSGTKIVGLDPEGLDLVVMQRIMSPRQVRMIEALHMRGVAVVVDVDDAIWRIDPRNSAHVGWNEVVEGKRRWEWLDEACARADLVTVATPALASRYGSHGRVKVLRNGLPNVAFAENVKTRFQDRIKIGWSGSVGTHPGDLEVMGGAVARIMANNDDVDLHVVGDAEPVADILSIPKDVQFSGRVGGTGWVPLDQYHAALRDIDIMLVPWASAAVPTASSTARRPRCSRTSPRGRRAWSSSCTTSPRSPSSSPRPACPARTSPPWRCSRTTPTRARSTRRARGRPVRLPLDPSPAVARPGPRLTHPRAAASENDTPTGSR